MAKSFYPNLSNIVTIDEMPEQLQFLETGLKNVLSKIYYKDFQFVKIPDGYKRLDNEDYFKSTLISIRLSFDDFEGLDKTAISKIELVFFKGYSPRYSMNFTFGTYKWLKAKTCPYPFGNRNPRDVSPQKARVLLKDNSRD